MTKDKILVRFLWFCTCKNNLNIEVFKAIFWIHEFFIAFPRLNLFYDLLICFVFIDDVFISLSFINKINRPLRSVTFFR